MPSFAGIGGPPPPPPPPPYEDFLGYTEVDPSGHITKTQFRVTWTNMVMSEHAYVYADKGVGHFANFEHREDVRQTAMEDDYYVMIWSLWNLVGYWNQNFLAGGPGIGIFAKRESGYAATNFKLVISQWHGIFQFFSETVNFLNINQTYYLTIKRSGASFTCDIYSDAARTSLIEQISQVLDVQCQVAYRYIYPLQAYGEAGWPQKGSGYVENLWLVS